jgi:hypothetical protein
MNILGEDPADIHDGLGQRERNDCCGCRLVGWSMLSWGEIIIVIPAIDWAVYVIAIINVITVRVIFGAIVTGVSSQVNARSRVVLN